MFQSSSGTHRVRHRLRTTASRLWLFGTPQRPLAGGGYRFELSIDPAFCAGAGIASFRLDTLAPHDALKSHPVWHGLRSSDTPPGSDCHRLSHATRSSSHFLLDAVSRSPNMPCCTAPSSTERATFGLGRRGELHPPAPSVAQRALLEALRFSVCLLHALASV